MTPLPTRTAISLLGLLACCVLSSCKTTQKSGFDDVVDYTSPKPKLSKEEYPFDDAGNYREDWAAQGAGVSGVKDKPNMTETPYVQEPDDAGPPTVASYTSSGSSSARKSSGSSSSRGSSASRSSGSSSRNVASRSKPKPKSTAKTKPKPKPAKPVVVTVKSGDTLYGISKRTGVPVSAIKAANGLKSDTIVDGKALKIPKKK